jgi:hypothetical protein
MGNTFVISGLKNKRARIAGEIVAAQRAIDQRRAELATLDAVVRMFSPDCDPDMIPRIRPGSHGLFFSYRELPRMILGIMRSTKEPMRFDRIVSQVILTKGIEPDGHLRKRIAGTARATLMRLASRGLVRRVLDEPDTWWELVRDVPERR